MSAHLDVVNGPEEHRVVLEASSVTIGSAPQCDVVLSAAWVAPALVRLESIAGAHRVVVEDKHDGVLVGGRPIHDHVLTDGDVIRISDAATGAFISLQYVNAMAPPIAAIQHFATPPGKALLTLGRSDCDIILNQPLVSQLHAKLTWDDDHHVLRDCESVHGTYVNGVRLGGAHVLRPDDVVQIGAFRLTYDGDSLDTLDQRGSMRLDARDLRRNVGRGPRARAILHDTTISIEPCEFVGLVGGSGAGKSTLLMALCGFRPADGGEVRVNGDDLVASFDAYRSILGLVPQDDILHRSLTVQSALAYTGRLRLPADTKDEELEARIDAALEAVDMLEHRGQVISDLSGGQRRRVSIASEMLSEPSLLFLDEPTSGLDPGLERRMMFTLRKLADGGRLVVLVTHATANIAQCDHIAFMAAGRLVFFGPPFQALEFFGADEFADIYSVTEGRVDEASALVTGELAEEWAAWRADNPEPAEPPPLAELWQRRFRDSLQYRKYAVERLARAPVHPSPEQQQEKQSRAVAYSQSSWRQLKLLSRRYLELLARDRRNLALLILQAPIIGFLLFVVARSNSLTSRIGAKKMTFMLAAIGVWFGVINAAREVCKENAIVGRERLAGVGAGPYVASKVAVLSLLVIAQSALLLGVLSLKVTMPSSGILMPAVVELFITLVLSGLAGIALGLCVSVIANTPDKASSLVPLVVVPQILFAGLMFNLRGATNMLSWFTASRWSMDAMSVIVDVTSLPSVYPLSSVPRYAASVENLLMGWGMLLVHAVGALGIAWFVLARRR